MAGFVYYLPSFPRPQATEPELRELGMGHALTGSGVQSCGCGRGPDANVGLLIVPVHAASARCIYAPERQTWQAAPGGKWWVGFHHDARPTAPDLARDRFAGPEVTLLDGQAWTIPIVHSIVRPPSLPRRLDLAEDGTWKPVPLPEHGDLYARAERIWLAFCNPVRSSDGDLKIKVEWAEAIAAAVAALAVNYRLSAAEVGLLGLLSTENVWEVLRAMVDYAAAEQAAAQLEAVGTSRPE